MVTRKGGMYSASPPPLMGGVPELRQWCVREFDRIREALDEGRSQFLRLDILDELPHKPVDGMVCYFSSNIVGSGSLQGMYEMRGGLWLKL